MSNLNTELLNTLLKNESVDEFFRQLLEDAINDLLQAELSACLGYEKYDSDGWGSGNSRNGSYSRTFDTRYGKLQIQFSTRGLTHCVDLVPSQTLLIPPHLLFSQIYSIIAHSCSLYSTIYMRLLLLQMQL